MANEQEPQVDNPCKAYNEMSKGWTLIDDLLAGSQAMRDNSATYLPQFSKEDLSHYAARVANSVLFSAYGDTVKNITSKPFSKPVTLQGELPPPLDEVADDVDDQGKPLGQLAKDILTMFVNRGVGHVLVDYPITVDENGETPNLQQERSSGLKPRLIGISPDQLIGWQTSQSAGGKPYLSRIRITETKTEPDGEWGEQEVQYVRVIEPDSWRLYRKVEEKEGYKYVLESEGTNSLGKVPLVTGYANQTGYLTAYPPLKELSEMNLAHYRSDTDQRNILHMARTVTLFLKGFTEEESQGVALGPNQLIATSNPNADAKFLEHTGTAIEAGAKDVEKLEERMVMLGLQPFLRRVGNQTATGQGIDESRANCDIQAWVMALEDMLYRAYLMAAEWVGVELPEDFKVDIFNDFAIWIQAAQHVADLIKMRQAGELSQVTFLREVKRRGLLSETVDIDTEIEDIKAEGPALADIGFEPSTSRDGGGGGGDDTGE